MNLSFNKLLLAGVLLLTFGLSSCEYDTAAAGSVMDAETGDPIVGARVMEIAITNKQEYLLEEGLTDSTGVFYFGGGLAGFGLSKVDMLLVVEKDSFRTSITDHFPEEFHDIRLQRY